MAGEPEPKDEPKDVVAPRAQVESLFVDMFGKETGDVILDLSLSRENLAVGGKFKVAFVRRVPCEACDGTGCTACEHGSKKVDASVEVDVPMGAGAGMQIRVPGEGHVRKGHPNGDVVVVLGATMSAPTSSGTSPLTVALFVVVTVTVLVFAIMMAR